MTLTRIERVLCGAFLLSIALAFSVNLESQFTLPKLLVVRALVPLIAIGWLARSRRGKTTPLPGSIIIASLALAGWWVFTTVTAVHPFTALHGEHGRYNGLLNQLLLLGLFLLIASAGLRLADVETLARRFVIALVPVSVYALIQYAGWDPVTWPGERSASTIGNPVILASVLGMAMPLALVFARHARRAGGRYPWLTVLGLLIAGSVTTLSRGPLLAGAMGLVLVGGVAAWENRQRVKPWMVGAGAVASAAVLVIGYRQVLQLREGLAGVRPLETAGTLQDRFNTYRAAVQIVRDHPLTGVGLENFSIVYPHYRAASSEQLTPDVLPTMVHDGYLQAAATTGLPGLLCYLVLVGSVLVMLVRAYRRLDDGRHRWLVVGVAASVLVCLAQDASGWSEISLSTFFWFVLGLGVALTQTEGSRVGVSTFARRAGALLVGAGASIAIGLAVESAMVMRSDYLIWSVRQLDPRANWPVVDDRLATALAMVKGDAAYLDRAGVRYAERYASTGDGDAQRKAIARLDDARRLNPFNPYYAIHRIALETAAIQKQAAVTPDLEDVVTALVSRDPNNGSVHEAVARLRLAQARPDEAMTALARAKALRPLEGRYDELEGDVDRAKNDRAAALTAYQAAATRLKGNTQAWVAVSHKLIVTLLERGQSALAIQEARQLVGRVPADSVGQSLLGYAYLGIKDAERARQGFEMALRINPGDQSARQGLAEANALRRQ